MDISSEELRGFSAYPEASLTHCNRKGLGMFKCEIITVLFLPFGWTISCLSIKESHYPPGALHRCFKQVEYCLGQNLQLLTCTTGPEHSPDLGVVGGRDTQTEVVHNKLQDAVDASLELDQWLMLWEMATELCSF